MIIKLDHSHSADVKYLFYASTKFMSSRESYKEVGNRTEEKVKAYHYKQFCEYYLQENDAYGYIEDGIIKALIGYSAPAAESYWNFGIMRSNGNGRIYIPKLLDKIIQVNESTHRYDFYSSVNAMYALHSKNIRGLVFSEWANERYEVIKEYFVPKNSECPNPKHKKELFFNWTYPIDIVVKHTSLKEKYRS